MIPNPGLLLLFRVLFCPPCSVQFRIAWWEETIYLWRHVVRGAHSALAVILLGNHPGKAEIGQFELQLGTMFHDYHTVFRLSYLSVVLRGHEENVFGLEVAVDDVLGVEEAEGDQDLDRVEPGQRLTQSSLGLYPVKEVT